MNERTPPPNATPILYAAEDNSVETMSPRSCLSTIGCTSPGDQAEQAICKRIRSSMLPSSAMIVCLVTLGAVATAAEPPTQTWTCCC
jgi:hypothetical protein